MSPAAKAKEPGEARMSFAEHLDELRKRMLRAAIVIGVIFALGWFAFPQQLERFFMQPHFWAVDRLAAMDPPITIERRLAVMSPLEEIFFRVKNSLLVAAIFGLPVLLWELWGFIGAGLFSHEKRAVMKYLPWSLALALAGMTFGYLLVIPLILQYLYAMPDQAIFVQTYRLESYFSLFTLFTLSLAAVFQMPLIMLGLHAAGIGSARFYGKYRKHFIVFAFIFAGVVTPPDPISQSLIAVPMMLLYEIGVLVMRAKERGRPPEDPEPEEADPA